ncbi:arylamine N-acetyltransferase family protein [Streptomyces marianii]|uniref:Arylamine N-acetyltransferase n=1 Tax=Streptomyces marianii TaxID=1817406 RepID=A0A5R9DXW4_9ACTN|nr:arylamine N-acetyltransferase [Streptomyces marianii]TLQ42458.1 arylamine N-acetyltransferase [Streptomyces marianii]
MIGESLVDAYLERIGAERPERADSAALRRLQERHVLSVPFENLDYHFDQDTDIVMDERVLDKIVHLRRGGGCYEINPALGLLLEALGYTVSILPAQVHRPDGLGSRQGHLVLRVDLPDGSSWLVDAGFRRNSRRPLRIGLAGPQQDPHGSYELHETAEGLQLDLDGTPLYLVDPRPCRIEDFGPTLWWFRTCPGSPFRQDLFCSLPTIEGRVTLKGNVLTRTERGERTRQVLADDAAVLAAYERYFGFRLDRLPTPPVLPEGSTGVQLD